MTAGSSSEAADVEFLVEIESASMPDLDATALADLVTRERARGHELRACGAIRRIWRIPGRAGSNVGIWEAPDATVLHELISSLPAFPWMDVRVRALAQHPLEATDDTEAPPC
jgi:muconolactone D-isomerase